MALRLMKRLVGKLVVAFQFLFSFPWWLSWSVCISKQLNYNANGLAEIYWEPLNIKTFLLCIRYRTGAYKEYTLELYELVMVDYSHESLFRSPRCSGLTASTFVRETVRQRSSCARGPWSRK